MYIAYVHLPYGIQVGQHNKVAPTPLLYALRVHCVHSVHLPHGLQVGQHDEVAAAAIPLHDVQLSQLCQLLCTRVQALQTCKKIQKINSRYMYVTASFSTPSDLSRRIPAL